MVAIATNNEGKATELAHAIDIDGFFFIPVSDVIDHWTSPIEDADTFEGNALIKARDVIDKCGMIALADDSGLVVDALGGAPGVFSSSFGGVEHDAERNNDHLLDQLAQVKDDDKRTARFVSTLVLVGLDRIIEGAPQQLVAIGSVEGRIGWERRGSHGFGYDPLFLPDETPGRTMAELTLDEKNAISHRGRAVRDLIAQLQELDALRSD